MNYYYDWLVTAIPPVLLLLLLLAYFQQSPADYKKWGVLQSPVENTIILSGFTFLAVVVVLLTLTSSSTYPRQEQRWRGLLEQTGATYSSSTLFILGRRWDTLRDKIVLVAQLEKQQKKAKYATSFSPSLS